MLGTIQNMGDGSLRLHGSRCIFLVSRLKPGVILTSVSGKDTGDLHDLPLRAISEEFTRFRRPVHWFVDASRAINAKNIVFRQWTEWFRAHQNRLAGVHVLTANEPMQLTVSIARHISGTADRMHLYEDAAPFLAALRVQVGFTPRLQPNSAFTDPPVTMERRVLPSGGVQLTGPRTSYRIELVGSGTVLTTIAGEDCGELGAAPVDEVQAAIAQTGRSAAWFVDTRDVRGRLARRVSEDWTAWLMAHESELQHVGVLSTSSAYPLILSIAKLRLRSPQIMQVYREQEEFEAALRRRDPAFKGLAAAAT